MGISIWEGNKAAGLAAASDRLANALESIAIYGTGAFSPVETWADVQKAVKAGWGRQLFPVGTQFTCKKETALSAALGTHTGITDCSVDEENFLAKQTTVESGTHTFTYDGSDWKKDGKTVTLSDYGITVTGSPANGDEVIVTETFTEILWDVVSHKDKRMVLLTHYAYTSSQLKFNVYADEAEALILNLNSQLVDNKTYKYTSTNGKSYVFTLTQAPPFRAVLRSTKNDADQEGASIKVYQDRKSSTVLETASVTEGDTADYSFTTNNLEKSFDGYNSYKWGDLRAWLNSGATESQWWTGDPTYNVGARLFGDTKYNGFLHGLDEDFVNAVAKTLVTTRTNDIHDMLISGWTETHRLYTTEDKFFLPSYYEVGGTNPEGNTDLVEAEPWDFFKGATDSDRLKKSTSGQSNSWILRTPVADSPSEINHVKYDGSFEQLMARTTCSIAIACEIG